MDFYFLSRTEKEKKQGRHENAAEENARVRKGEEWENKLNMANKMVVGKLCNNAVIFIMRVIERMCIIRKLSSL